MGGEKKVNFFLDEASIYYNDKFTSLEDKFKLLEVEEFHPESSIKNHPDWYKTLILRVQEYGVQLGPKDTEFTVKACVPFQDFISSGYVIKLAYDLEITYSEMNDQQELSFGSLGDLDLQISRHSNTQLKTFFDNPYFSKVWSNQVAKFNNQWLIEVPKGYSVMFVPVLLHDPRFMCLPAVVDCDNYVESINFPFLWNRQFTGKHVIEAGTAFIMAIPFKREKYKLNVGVAPDAHKEKPRGFAKKFLRANWIMSNLKSHRYRDYFWSREKNRYK